MTYLVVFVYFIYKTLNWQNLNLREGSRWREEGEGVTQMSMEIKYWGLTANSIFPRRYSGELYIESAPGVKAALESTVGLERVSATAELHVHVASQVRLLVGAHSELSHTPTLLKLWQHILEELSETNHPQSY